MKIQATDAYRAYSESLLSSRSRAASLVAPANTAAARAGGADTVTVSQAARNLLAAQSARPATPADNAPVVLDTDRGAQAIDIDAYFTPGSAAYAWSAESIPPLLAPTPNNIAALSKHVSAAMPQFLAANGIPSPPASITYDNYGQMQLPAEYPYAAQFKDALANNPAMSNELRTVSALGFSRNELSKSIPFQQEYAAAGTAADAQAVTAKYAHLFSNNRFHDAIVLHLSANGSVSLTANGRPLS